jgi:hypothetical protein
MGLPPVMFPFSPASLALGHWIAFGLPPKLMNMRNYFCLVPLDAEMLGLCPRVDYRLQWGDDGEVLVNLLTFFRLKAPSVAQQCCSSSHFSQALAERPTQSGISVSS